MVRTLLKFPHRADILWHDKSDSNFIQRRSYRLIESLCRTRSKKQFILSAVPQAKCTRFSLVNQMLIYFKFYLLGPETVFSTLMLKLLSLAAAVYGMTDMDRREVCVLANRYLAQADSKE